MPSPLSRTVVAIDSKVLPPPPVVPAVEALLLLLVVPSVKALLLLLVVPEVAPLLLPLVVPALEVAPLFVSWAEALLPLPVVLAVEALSLPLACAALPPRSSPSCFTVSLSEAAISSPLSRLPSGLESCCPDTATKVS
jgi:hypothetical protein